jgi:methyl-accepting chemotaxis protein
MGAGGLLALVLFSTVAAILVVIGMRDDQARITDRELSYGEAVDAAALQAKGVANDERGFLLSGSDKFLVEAERRIGSARSAFGTAREVAATPQQHEAANAALAGFERWVSAVRREVADFKSGNHRVAIDASLGESRTLRKDYERSLTQAQALDVAQLASSRQSIDAESSRSIRALSLFLGCALVVGALIAAWLVRAIAVPVARLVALLSSTGTETVPVE